MPMTEMEQKVIASVKQRFGTMIDLAEEPGVLLEVLRLYKDDLKRTHAAPEEYVQVQMGAVGGMAQAESVAGLIGAQGSLPIAGEITNSELMLELLRLRKAVEDLAKRIP